MTVDIEEPADFVNDLSRGWIMAGNVLVRSLRHNETGFAAVNQRRDRMQASADARFDALEERVDGVQGQLNRLEVATEARFDRIDATLEELKAMVAALEPRGRAGRQRPER